MWIPESYLVFISLWVLLGFVLKNLESYFEKKEKELDEEEEARNLAQRHFKDF